MYPVWTEQQPLPGLMRVCLGHGKNGIVRYIREAVIAYDESRRVE